jgi:hypothetical protein
MVIERWETDLAYCGKLENPGIPIDGDWHENPTTPDQEAIEDALDAMDLAPDTQILHVGVGNSSLALRFTDRVQRIDGVTVSIAEQEFAEDLELANSQVFVVNKYSPEFGVVVLDTYDFIIDNNLASFACCQWHFHQMFDNYLACLRPGGRILTDQAGMNWVASGDPRWMLDEADLGLLGERCNLSVRRLTDTVYEMRRH